MNYYTETIPIVLAEKLKEKGMPMGVWQGWATPYITVIENSDYDWLDKELGNEPSTVERRYSVPSYAEVFDWLMEGEICTRIIPFRERKGANGTLWAWSWFINRLTQPSISANNFWMNWHEAANAAIEKAIELI